MKRLYAEAHRLPVFQDVPGGPLLAFKSKLREHYKALSAAKELAIAAAAAQPETQNAATTTEREARLSRQSKRRPRDAVGRKFNKQREREIA